MAVGSELEVVESPGQGVHALLTAVDGDDHAAEVAGHD